MHIISDASIITAFRQGVHDEKMLEKLATHEVESVTTLFSLADKCARAAEGRARHSAPQDGPSKREALVPPFREVTKRRRTRTAVIKGRSLELRSLRQQPGAITRGANACAHRVATAAPALSVLMPATALLTAARSRSSRSASARHQTPSPVNPRGPDPNAGPLEIEVKALVFTEPHWTLFFDGSIRKKRAGTGVVLIDPNEGQVKYIVHLEFEATNNMAKYEALIFGLMAALSLGVR